MTAAEYLIQLLQQEKAKDCYPCYPNENVKVTATNPANTGSVTPVTRITPKINKAQSKNMTTTAYRVLVAGALITVIDKENKALPEFEESMRDRFGERYQGIKNK